MVWELRVEVIGMLTKPVEGGAVSRRGPVSRNTIISPEVISSIGKRQAVIVIIKVHFCKFAVFHVIPRT